MWGYILLFLVILCNAEKVQNFESSKDVVFFTRAEEVIVFGLFKDLKSKQAKTFKKVAKKYNAGFKFGQSSDASVWSRYDGIVDTSKNAEVLILRNFREDGEPRRTGKDKVVFSGKFTKKELNKFIISEALPAVMNFPDCTKHGVDGNNRFQYAQGLKIPTLYCFRKEAGHSPLLGKVGQTYAGRVQIFDIDAGHPDSKSFVEGLNPKYNEENFAAVLVGRSIGQIPFEGKFDQFDLELFLQESLGSKDKKAEL